MELGAAAPAHIFGLEKKGTVAVGMDADLVIFNADAKGVRSAKTHFSKADRSIFEGFDVKGAWRRPSSAAASRSRTASSWRSGEAAGSSRASPRTSRTRRR